MDLGRGAIETTGLNAGLAELATAAEICAYFEQVMAQVLLPTGRVHFLPKHRYLGDGTALCLLTGAVKPIRVRKKIVDATLIGGSIPSKHVPGYHIAPGVRHMPVNGLVDIDTPPQGYVIIGAGKTGMDACLWLMQQGIDPDIIHWVKPQDSWLLDRAQLQSADVFFETIIGSLADQMETIAAAPTMDALFAQLEEKGLLFRIDQDVQPTAYRCATITKAELEALRRIRNVIRMGRIQAIEPGRMVMDKGDVPTKGDIVYVDCSAKGIGSDAPQPIFEDGLIRLQTVRTCQPTFSMALIGFLEAHHEDDAYKNKLCTPVPIPHRPVDWLSMHISSGTNAFHWLSDAPLTEWISKTRLNASRAMMKPESALTPVQLALRTRLQSAMPDALANAMRLMQ